MSTTPVVIPFPSTPMVALEQEYASHLDALLEDMHACITYEREGHVVQVESVHATGRGTLFIEGIDSISGARVDDEVPVAVTLAIAFTPPCVQLSFGDTYPEVFLYKEPQVA